MKSTNLCAPLVKAALLLVIYSTAVCAEQSDNSSVSYYCDPKTSSFVITEEYSEVSWPKAMQPNRFVRWGRLLKWGPQTNGRGGPLRTGSRVVNQRCGKLGIRVEGGYLNDNPNGMYGAMEFPVIELTLDKRLVLPRTAIDVCVAGDTRYTAYYGACPSEWARSIQATIQPDGKVNITIKRKYIDDNGDEQPEIVEVIER